MNKNLTELIFILDMSGSMAHLRDDTIGGYNTLLEEQKKAEGDALVTTILFDNRYIVLHDRKPIQEVNPITKEEYAPLGMTALLDAVGKTIVNTGHILENTPEEERPGRVLVTIITDGYENASKEYSWSSVQSMIKEQREKYSWLFSFIGANIDNIAVSDQLGIDRGFSKKYTANKIGTESVYKTMSASIAYSRKAMRDAVDTGDLEEADEKMSKMMDDIK